MFHSQFSAGNMFARKFEEFALQDRMKIGVTTIDKIPDKSSRDSTDETPPSARSTSSSSETSADSGLASPFSPFAGDVSPQAAKIFALAKMVEFSRSAQVLSMLSAAKAKTQLAEEEMMRDEMSQEEPEMKTVGQDESNDESGVGSEVMKSDAASDIGDEDVIIGETDEVDMAQTGKKLPHFLLDLLGSRRHQDLISWTFTEGFSFQIEKLKEVAELWCQQRPKIGRTPNPKKKVKMSQTVQLTRSLKHYTDKGVLRRISEDSLCYAFTDHPGKFPVASQKWRDFYEFSLATGLVPKQE